MIQPALADLRVVREDSAAAPLVSVFQAFHVVDGPDIYTDSMVPAVSDGLLRKSPDPRVVTGIAAAAAVIPRIS